MKRITKPVRGSVPADRAAGGHWVEYYPTLVDHMTETAYTDPPGPRTPNTLTLRVTGKTWTATLRDRDSASMLTVEAATPDGVLAALESVLGAETPPWQFDPWAKSPPKKR